MALRLLQKVLAFCADSALCIVLSQTKSRSILIRVLSMRVFLLGDSHHHEDCKA